MAKTRLITNRRLTRGAIVIIAAAVSLVVAVGIPAKQLRLGVAAAPIDDGQWAAPVSWPLVAVHASVLPSGKVLVFDAFSEAPNSERLWDPATETFVSVPNGSNLFCAGHALLADGRLAVVGGHISSNVGLDETNLFDPTTGTWSQGARMARTRWYPTVTTTGDGRLFVVSGDNMQMGRTGVPQPFVDTSNTLPEVYEPATNTWTSLTAGQRAIPLYPFMFVMPDGRIFDAGPDTINRALDLNTGSWTEIATSPIDGGSAVMYRAGKILKSGTWGDAGVDYPSDSRAAVIDLNQGSPTWREVAGMSRARSFHNLIVLPDGDVLALGGALRSGGANPAQAVLEPELFDVETETWRTLAPMQHPRLYHSTSLLLPDGRILIAGGGRFQGNDQLSAEVYSPPYLFKGTRPSISSAPSSAIYGSSFTVETPDAASISSVSLIRLGSMTHAYDENQRYVDLSFTRGTNSLSVQAPASGNVAPPGHYMLFVVNGSGVPSIASIVRVDATTGDTSPPTVSVTAPAAGATVAGTASLTASASDDVGVIGVQFKVDGTNVGVEDTTAPYSASWDSSTVSNGSHTITAVARDAAGNSTTSAVAGVTVSNAAAGLVAAYGFDEGSGTAVGDRSGSGNNGTLAGAAWTTAGRFGGALTFDGTNDWVTVPDSASLDLTNGMTVEAWVRPSALGNDWRTVAFKEATGDVVYSLYAHETSQRPNTQINVGGERNLRGSGALATNTWTHIASTYDGATLRLYVNGVQNATLAVAGSMAASAGPLRIGGNGVYPEWFAGQIDELRVYDRALAAAEIQTDMNTSVTTPDAVPPSVPSGLTASGSISSVSLSWAGSSDNVGVIRYNVHRSTTPGFTPTALNRVAQPTTTSYVDAGLAAGTYYYRVVAEDAALNTSAPSNEATASVTGDTLAPTTPANVTATPGAGQVSLAWAAATDNVGVTRYNVHRSPTSGFTPDASNRVAQPTSPSYTDTGLATGTYYYRLTAEDAAGNLSAASTQVSANVAAPPAPTGLVAAYSFDEGGGTALGDSSGNANNGTISGATWTTAGRFGSALSFDGTNDIVNIADSASLDVASGLTLEAWVYPTALGNTWRTVLMKEMTGNLVYALYAGRQGNQLPVGEVLLAGNHRTVNGGSVLPLNQWSHLALTYDGSNLRLFLNGTQSAILTTGGAIGASTGALRIGGNNVWPEWFAGRIDEARIYNRALTATELQTDMNRSVGSPDSSSPSAPGTVTATGGLSSVSLTWGAATDDTGVVRYNVHRSTVAGFTPSTLNRVAQPTVASYADSGLAAGTYFYKVTAEDAAGNVGPTSNEALATVTGDTVSPSAPTSLTATGSLSSVALSWSASSDNVGVIRYNVHRATTAGFTPSTANRIAQPTTTSYTDAGLSAGTYHYKVVAEDAAGNLSLSSPEANAPVTGDVSAPSTPASLTATAGGGQASLSWPTSTDNVGVTRYNVHRSTTSGFTPGAANRIAQPTGTSYTDTGLATGTYYYRVTAEDAAGNISGPSPQATATISSTPPPADLVAAYSFDEGSGTSVTDLSGNGNNGTISGPTWTTTGRFGNALTFDGVDDWVTIPDSASLDLSSGMTLMAWVRASQLGTAWRTVLFKEQAGELVYGLYANEDTLRPDTQVYVAGAPRHLKGTAQIAASTWVHLAATYDGTTQRLYVDGTEVSSRGQTGAITTSTGVLRIGGNNVWPEWFAGAIDEIRVYDRGLSAAEVQTDMTRSVGTPDTNPPSAPGLLTGTGAIARANLVWGAASDDIGVVRYNVHRSGSAGFTPSDSNRIAQPTGTSYTDTGLAAGTYHYKVTAQDGSSNVGLPSNEVSVGVTADTHAPTTPTGVAASGGPGQVSVSWNASTDNVSVLRYNLHRSTAAGFTPSAGNRIAQPSATSFGDTGLGPGTYFYRVTAEDPSGNVSAASAEVSAVVTSAPPVGLVAAYGFNEATGTTASDSSGNANAGTIAGASRVPLGRIGTALSFDGVNDWVTVADSASLDVSTGLTLEAWVKPTVNGSWRALIVKEQTNDLAYGLYASQNTQVPQAQVWIAGGPRGLNGPSQLPLNTWTHLAATYDGAMQRIFVNGVQVASRAQTGTIGASTGSLRLGGVSIWPEWYSGLIDEVRVYNRALTQAQIQADMTTPISPDSTAPSVNAVFPAADATNVTVGPTVVANFSEPMDAASVATGFELRDSANALVPATVIYDHDTAKATLTPSGALLYDRTYTATVRGGTGGVRDASGNALAANRTWSFSTEPTPPPVLVLKGESGFGGYIDEILRAEGISAFTTLSVSTLSPSLLDYFDVVVLGEAPLTAAQVTALSNWVTAGGNLIALRPSKQLASLLGLTDAGSTLTNGYLRVNTGLEVGGGLASETMQFHGTADRYTTSAATSVATLYSDAATATTSPAVTIRAVGSNGGQAAAFMYDLARSIVYTRQGNPTWSGLERDGLNPIRPDDLFFGAAAGDVQPDWIDISKLAIPQADEQQRLLANLILTMSRDRKPLPRFWYFPRDEKAVVVMTGDDHDPQNGGGTAGRFDQYKALSPAGCSVVLWECIRSTSYIYPQNRLTNAQASAYVTDGFELSIHSSVNNFSTDCLNFTQTSLEAAMTTQLGSFTSKYTGIPAPATERTHCVTWSDWATHAKVSAARGIRLDTNYYHYPGTWIGSLPGFMTGSGLPMKFSDLDGTVIDLFQAHTHLTDESGQSYPFTIDSVLDKAIGSEGYFGFFLANIHTDQAASAASDAILASAQARGVPVISAAQLLQWTEGRNASTFRNFSWSGGTLGFTIVAGAGATGLRAMLPIQGGPGTLQSIARGGTPAPFTTTLIKGIAYAVFDAQSGAYTVTYAP